MSEPKDGLNAVEIGTTVSLSKTIGEYDVYSFAGITGDFSPNHVNEQYMKGTPYGTRIAHGVLGMGFASTASSLLLAKITEFPCVSYGYDRIRFVKPILIGDTITVTYTVQEKVAEKNQLRSQVVITNQHGEVATVATHILQFV